MCMPACSTFIVARCCLMHVRLQSRVMKKKHTAKGTPEITLSPHSITEKHRKMKKSVIFKRPYFKNGKVFLKTDTNSNSLIFCEHFKV